MLWPIAISILLLGVAMAGDTAKAQPKANPDQKAALQAAAQMMEGQRTYFQKNGAFRATVSNLQQDSGITCPPPSIMPCAPPQKPPIAT